MATIVDALVVTLGFDLSAFKRGKAEASAATKKLSAAERAAAKEIEENNKRAAESFRRIRNEVLALVSIFTAGVGIKQFTESTINSAVNLGYMAQNLQMSTRDLSAWQRAAERAGGSAEGITAALQASQNEVSGLKFGRVSEGMQWFLRLGGKPEEFRDGNTYLLARARIISNMFKIDPGRARFIAQQMGIGDSEFNLLKQGEAAVLALVDAQKKNSAVTEKQAEQALKLKNEWLDLRDRLQYVGTTVLLELMPTFEKLIGKLQNMADWVADHKADISAWIDKAVVSIQKFIEWADKAADSVGGWKNVIAALLALKILSIVAPLLQLGVALTGVGTGLGLIGRAGPAALAALAALWGAKKLGLPDVDAKKGIEDVRRGDFLAASTHLPAMDLIRAFSDRMRGKSYEDIAKELEKRLEESNKGGADDFAQQLASMLSGSANAAEVPGASGIPADLARKAGPDAVAAALRTQQKYGVPAAVTLAQFGLESSFGTQMPAGSNNPFGIHARAGQDFVMGYDWDASGNRVPTKFAKYASLADAFEAHGRLLANGRAYAEARKHLDDPMAYAAALTGKYATDPKYGAKLQAMMGGAVMSAAQANAARIAQQTAAAAAPAGSNSTSTTTNTNEMHVNGPITIQTQATDAPGIARDLGGALRRYSFVVPQANTGLS